MHPSRTQVFWRVVGGLDVRTNGKIATDDDRP
jgi:hypothetical protein